MAKKPTKPTGKTPKEKKAKTLADLKADMAKTSKALQGLKHSSRRFIKAGVAAILSAQLPALTAESTDEDKDMYRQIAEVRNAFIKLIDTLGGSIDGKEQAGVAFQLTRHWRGEVGLPKFTKAEDEEDKNPHYFGPLADRVAALPDTKHLTSAQDPMKEYAAPKMKAGYYVYAIDPETGEEKLVHWYDELGLDRTYVDAGKADFGPEWDAEGMPTIGNDGHPVLSGWPKSVLEDIKAYCDSFSDNAKARRPFIYALCFHTRDLTENKAEMDMTHVGAHAQILLLLPRKQTRYQVMDAMGAPFDLWADCFNWLTARTPKVKANDRPAFWLDHMAYLIGNIMGTAGNFVLVNDSQNAMKYIVHDSKKSRGSGKERYRVAEVFYGSTLHPNETYSQATGVYDDVQSETGADGDLVRELHSPEKADLLPLIGRRKTDGKMLTWATVVDLRNAWKVTGTGKKIKQEQALSLLKCFKKHVDAGDLEMNDFQTAMRAALPADYITEEEASSSPTRLFKLYETWYGRRVADLQVQAVSKSKNVIFITSRYGGQGKSRLGRELAKATHRGHTPFVATVPGAKKTPDLFQGYHGESTIQIDEVDGHTFGIEELYTLMDPHTRPTVPSRFHQVSLYGADTLICTKTYGGGIMDYFYDALTHAPGVMRFGYLETKDGETKYQRKTGGLYTKRWAQQTSQLARRFPIWIAMDADPHQHTTTVTVCLLNVNLDRQPVLNERGDPSYVSCPDLQRTFRFAINDQTTDRQMAMMTNWVKSKLAACDTLRDAALSDLTLKSPESPYATSMAQCPGWVTFNPTTKMKKPANQKPIEEPAKEMTLRQASRDTRTKTRDTQDAQMLSQQIVHSILGDWKRTPLKGSKHLVRVVGPSQEIAKLVEDSPHPTQGTASVTGAVDSSPDLRPDLPF